MGSTVFSFEVQGLSKVLKRIEDYDKAVAVDVDNELTKGAENIALTANLLCPIGQHGDLAASIAADTSVKYKKVIGTPLFYAPYVEFGTGVNVFKNHRGFVFDARMKEFAKEFYVSGLGTMEAQPFMFPALVEWKPKILSDVKKVLFTKR